MASRRADMILDQLWRAASSISANIAEGAAQDSHRQFARYLTIALGSANEAESHLSLASQAGLLDPVTGQRMIGEIGEIKRMLWVFRDRVRRDPRGTKARR
jgi:four helix bundle protein